MLKSRLIILRFLIGGLVIAPLHLVHASALNLANTSQQQSVTSGSFLAAPIAKQGGANPNSSLTISLTSGSAYFYIRNFGSVSIASITITQSSSIPTISYCGTQGFKGNTNKCRDGSNPIVLGSGLNLGRKVLSQSLAVATAQEFYIEAIGVTSTTISVEVDCLDLIPATTYS